jgi:hypothetical protein
MVKKREEIFNKTEDKQNCARCGKLKFLEWKSKLCYECNKWFIQTNGGNKK